MDIEREPRLRLSVQNTRKNVWILTGLISPNGDKTERLLTNSFITHDYTEKSTGCGEQI